MNFFNNILGYTLSLSRELFSKETDKRGLNLKHTYTHIMDLSYSKFKEHESHSEVHKVAVDMAGEFQKSMENKSLLVTQQLIKW